MPLPSGGFQVVVAAAVRGPAGLLSRPVAVAARGFRVTAVGTRAPLNEAELVEHAMGVNSSLFYER